MQKIRKYIVGVILIVGFLLMFQLPTVLAAESGNLGYTVKAILPETQIDNSKSYFYIQTLANEEQKLKVKVASTQKDPIKLNIYIEDAYTGNKGTIEYTNDSKMLDKSLVNPVSSLIQIETPHITLENFEEKIVTIKVKPPKESYTGIKMSVLNFELDESSDANTQVTNSFAYRLGLFLSESGDEFKDSTALALNEVKASIVRGKKMVLANLINSESKVIDNLRLTAKIKEVDSGKTYKELTVENYVMAPNSNFNLEIDLGTDDVKSGKYVLVLTGNNEYDEWTFEKNFNISGELSKKLNEESSFKIITPQWIKIVTTIEILVILIITGALIIRQKKFKEEIKKSKKRKKRRK